jgi:hypothetical protein
MSGATGASVRPFATRQRLISVESDDQFRFGCGTNFVQ